MDGIILCGTMFGLKVYRHRRFESNVWLWEPPHPRHKEVIGSGRMLNDRADANGNGWVSLPSNGKGGKPNRLAKNYHADEFVCVGGHNFRLPAQQAALGIDWMTRKELAQAIPPAYTEYVGRQLIEVVRGHHG